ncbi:MAG: type II secretion system F family protein [Steroidobacteraceae bacterium]
MRFLVALLGAAAAGAFALAVAALIRPAAQSLRRSAIDAPAGALADLFIFIAPQRLLRASAAAALGGLVLAFVLTRSWLIASLGSCVVFAAPRVMHHVMRRRYRRRIGEQLPDAMSMLAGTIRAGAALAQGLDQLALRVAPPLGHELALVMRRHRIGVRFDEALRDFGRRVPLPEAQLLVTALTLTLQVGGSLGGALDRLTDTLRRKHVVEAKLRALTSQGRLQAIIVTALPVALMLALTALDPASMRPLYTTAGGWMVLGGIAMLETTGWLLIRRIVSVPL